MRRVWILVVLLAALLSGRAHAQSCDGCGIGYRAPGISGGGSITGPLVLNATPLEFCDSAGANCAYMVRDGAAEKIAMRNGGTAGSPNHQSFSVYKFCAGTDCATGFSKMLFSSAGASDFYITNSVGGTGAAGSLWVTGFGGMFAPNLYPVSDDSTLLGSGSFRYGHLYLSRTLQGGTTKALTDAAAATPAWRIAVANNGYIGGQLLWAATSTDATDYVATSGSIQFAGVNKGGTVTCAVSVIGTDVSATSNANTLVCTWTNVTSTTNCDLSVTCTNNTVGSQSISLYSRINEPIPAANLPQ